MSQRRIRLNFRYILDENGNGIPQVYDVETGAVLDQVIDLNMSATSGEIPVMHLKIVLSPDRPASQLNSTAQQLPTRFDRAIDLTQRNENVSQNFSQQPAPPR